MIVVDTSVWIAYFRGHDESLVAKLNELLDDDQVLLPAPIWVELLSGASKKGLPVLKTLMSALPKAFPTKATWKTVETWVTIATRRGQRFGMGDLLIAGICAENDASVWSLDNDFFEMAKMKFIRAL